MRKLIVLAVMFAAGGAQGKPRWKKVDVNPASVYEAAGVADLDGDGRLDIFSGDSWYRAPRWSRTKVRDLAPSPNPHYNEDFGNMPLDVNGDGKPDMVTCSFFGKLLGWIEHPGDPKKPWVTHEIDRPGASEACRLADIDGDGKPELFPARNNVAVYYELTPGPQPRWDKQVVGTQGVGHGNGLGDLDGDGRVDIIVPRGWYRQPAGGGAWTFHPEFDLGGAGIMALGRDVDGDGLADVVSGMGHDYGLYWWKQGKGEDGKRSWTRHDIDRSFSQVHTLLWADLDGTGQPALVTGKRVYAHEVEPGATEPPGIYAFRFDRAVARWTREVIWEGQPARNAPEKAADRWAQKDFPRGTAGTGLDIAVADVDKDGDLDLVCPGKSGLYLFLNPRPRRR